MTEVVPDRHAHIAISIQNHRHFTPDKEAFGDVLRCFWKDIHLTVSSFLMELFQRLGRSPFGRSDILKDHSLLSSTAFDPHVEEGKK